MFLTLSLTIVPSILIAVFVIFSDKFREPIGPIIIAFLLGFLIIIPAIYLNTFFAPAKGSSNNLAFIAGFTEEPLKFIALYFFLRNRVEYDEPMDAIVYATLLSLGFATLENFEYVYSSGNELVSYEIAVIRAFSAIPLHACCGVIMGYYFGLYSFQGSTSFLVKSISLPTVIHAFYNYLCDFNGSVLFIYVPVLIFYATYLIDKMAGLQSLTGKIKKNNKVQHLSKHDHKFGKICKRCNESLPKTIIICPKCGNRSL